MSGFAEAKADAKSGEKVPAIESGLGYPVKIRSDESAVRFLQQNQAVAATLDRSTIAILPEFAACHAVLAHEYAHIAQLRSGLSATRSDSEHGADEVASGLSSSPGGAAAPPLFQNVESANKRLEIAGDSAHEKPEPKEDGFGVEAKHKFKLKEIEMRDYGGISVGGAIYCEVKVKTGAESGAGVSYSHTEVEISQEIKKTALGDFEFKVAASTEEKPKIGFEFGGKHIGLELALNASLVSSFSVKYKYKLSELDFLRQSLRDLKVDGEVELTVEFDVRPTIKGLFAAATRVGSGVVRAYGVVSTPSVIAAGAFAATVYFAGKSMIVLGEANYKGKEDAIGMFFSRGFASMLAKLTEPEVPDLNANLFKVDWRASLDEGRRLYHEPGLSDAPDLIWIAGEKKALQSTNLMSSAERQTWAKAHRDAIPGGQRTREMKFLADLTDQLQRGVRAEDLFVS